jgi:hypothetical protein
MSAWRGITRLPGGASPHLEQPPCSSWARRQLGADARDLLFDIAQL